MDDRGKLTLLFLLIVAQGESLLESPDQLTWVEAQRFCRDRNSTLIPGTKEGFPTPHWTGLYHRLSDWIHVLGCYEREAVMNLVVLSNHTLDRGSVGLCQERCGNKSFALKNITCLCLRDIVQVEGVSTTRCNWNCSHDDDSHVNDCGGRDTYNVYKVTPRDDGFPSGRTVNCVVLGCYEQYWQIHTNNCTEDLGRVCKSEVGTNKTIAPDEENFKSWSQTYAECRDTGGYLYGNLSLFENPQALCTRLYDMKSNTPETWLGIARQIFLTKDRGEQLTENLVIDCQICLGQGGCSHEDMCSSSVKATALCGNESDLLSQTEVTPRARTDSSDGDTELAIAITVPIVILGILFAVIGVVCIRRRKKEQEEREDVPRKKYEDNILFESAQSKGSLTKENGNGENVQLESPHTGAKPKDVTNGIESTNDNLTNGADNKPERERVVEDSSGVNSDVVDVEPVLNSDIKLQPTVQIPTENKADDKENTEYINSDIRLQPTVQIPTENKADNEENTENISSDISNANEEMPEMTQIASLNKDNEPEDNPNDTKENSEFKEITISDSELNKQREESAPLGNSTEKTNMTKTDLNAPRDTTNTNQVKDSGIRLPLIKANSALLRTTGKGSEKKNVSIIQVTKI